MLAKTMILLKHREGTLNLHSRFCKQACDFGAVRTRFRHAVYVQTPRQIIYHVDDIIELGHEQVDVFAVNRSYEGRIELFRNLCRKIVAHDFDSP